MALGFRSEKLELVKGKIALGSAEPKDFIEQIKQALEERDGTGSIRDEGDKSFLHELSQELSRVSGPLGQDIALKPGDAVNIIRQANEKQIEELGFSKRVAVAPKPDQIVQPPKADQ